MGTMGSNPIVSAIYPSGTIRQKFVSSRTPADSLESMSDPRIFRDFKTSPEIIRPAVMMYVRSPLSLRNVEDLLHERGIDITHETVRFWWNRLGAIFAAEIRCNRVQAMRSLRHKR
jgi:hypothetical protein